MSLRLVLSNPDAPREGENLPPRVGYPALRRMRLEKFGKTGRYYTFVVQDDYGYEHSSLFAAYHLLWFIFQLLAAELNIRRARKKRDHEERRPFRFTFRQDARDRDPEFPDPPYTARFYIVPELFVPMAGRLIEVYLRDRPQQDPTSSYGLDIDELREWYEKTRATPLTIPVPLANK